MRTTLGIVGCSIIAAAGCASFEETETDTDNPPLDTEIESLEDLSTVDRVAGLSDGSLVLGGRADEAVALLKLTPEGDLDDSYADEGVLALDEVLPDGQVSDLVALDDDSVLVTGYSAAGGWIARITSDGAIDGDFAAGGLVTTEAPMSLTVRADQSLLVALDPHAGQVIGLALDKDGAPDPTVGDGGYISAFQFTASDQYFAGRTAIALSDPEVDQIAISTLMDGQFATAVFYLDGSARFMVTTGTPFHPRSLVAVEDGFVVGGTGASGMTAAKFDTLARFGEQAFGDDGMAASSVVSAEVATLADGAGNVVLAGSDGHPALVRILPDGTLDPSFDGDGVLVDTATEAEVSDAALLGDGSVVVVGSTDGQGFVGTYAMP